MAHINAECICWNSELERIHWSWAQPTCICRRGTHAGELEICSSWSGGKVPTSASSWGIRQVPTSPVRRRPDGVPIDLLALKLQGSSSIHWEHTLDHTWWWRRARLKCLAKTVQWSPGHWTRQTCSDFDFAQCPRMPKGTLTLTHMIRMQFMMPIFQHPMLWDFASFARQCPPSHFG